MKRADHIMASCAMALALTGCSSNQMATGSLSPIAAQSNDFKVTVAQGAMAGALIGGITGAITGKGDTQSIVKGALIGGAAGAVGGYYIAGQKHAYASKEDALNAVAADTRQRNDKLASILTTTDQVIARRRADLSKLQTSTAVKQEKINAQKSLLAELDADKAALNQAIESARQHGQQIDGNIAELKKQFPDDKDRTLDEVAGAYHRNTQSLEQKPSDVFRMIDETSKIRVES